ncbi:sulfite exporter TauE/SafE family protein [Patescibacteria group bacterium]|nr:sulfite exporter TauE/SafE family protein [Patescibacteria group bacterium]
MTQPLPACCVVPTRSLRTRLWQALLALLSVGLIAAVIWPMVATFIPQAQSGASLAAMFGLGVVASLSTCLATTGAFLLAHGSRAKSFNDVLSIHIGRLIAFVAGGALLGLLGGSLGGSPLLYGMIGLVLGIGFLAIGFQLLEITPSSFSFLKLPSGVYGSVNRFAERLGPTVPGLLGVVTFFLPCGFTQTAQALALASGSPWSGALMLGAFALGTAPVLVGLSWYGQRWSGRSRILQLATGAALVLFAVGQLDGGLTVLGSPVTFSGLLNRAFIAAVPIPVAQAEEQVVQMTVEYGAFSPNRFVIRKDVPVLWAVEGKDVSGCASTLISPRLGISRQLSLGTTIIKFTPKQAGEVPFSCGMGMIRGSFQVVE